MPPHVLHGSHHCLPSSYSFRAWLDGAGARLVVADTQTFEDTSIMKDGSGGDAQDGEVALLCSERAKDIFLAF